MYTNTIALAGVFAVLASAIPLAGKAKREIVWVTETSEAIVTVPVTTTVWVDPPMHYGHGHGHGSPRTSTILTTIPYSPEPSSASAEPAAVSSVEASSYVAPTTSAAPYVAPTTSTSVYVAPTTSAYVAPTTSLTSIYVAPTTSSSAPPAATSAASSGGSGLSSGMGASGTSYSGDLTYFAVGMGACGVTSVESDHMVAVSEKIFDSYSAETGGNPNKNPLCGKSITITGADGSPYTAQIWDRCPGCDEGSLDLPQAFFNTVTYNPATKSSGDGRVKGMKWSFN